jgi:hypothetical protein
VIFTRYILRRELLSFPLAKLACTILRCFMYGIFILVTFILEVVFILINTVHETYYSSSQEQCTYIGTFSILAGVRKPRPTLYSRIWL